MDVLVAAPAEEIGVALASTFSAPVEEQDAVAVGGEHSRVLLRAAATRKCDHGGAVFRRDVPALEPQSIARLERDVLVLRAQVGRRHRRTQDVRDHVAEANRRNQAVGDEEGSRREQRPTDDPPEQTAVAAPRAPEHDSADRDEQDPGGNGEDTTEVVTGRADRDRRVETGSRPDGDREETDREGQSRHALRRGAADTRRRWPPGAQAGGVRPRDGRSGTCPARAAGSCRRRRAAPPRPARFWRVRSRWQRVPTPRSRALVRSPGRVASVMGSPPR